MSNFKKLSHVIYRCTYHIVLTPKYRYRILESIIKEQLLKDILMLLEWKSCEIDRNEYSKRPYSPNC